MGVCCECGSGICVSRQEYPRYPVDIKSPQRALDEAGGLRR